MKTKTPTQFKIRHQIRHCRAQKILILSISFLGECLNCFAGIRVNYRTPNLTLSNIRTNILILAETQEGLQKEQARTASETSPQLPLVRNTSLLAVKRSCLSAC